MVTVNHLSAVSNIAKWTKVELVAELNRRSLHTTGNNDLLRARITLAELDLPNFNDAEIELRSTQIWKMKSAEVKRHIESRGAVPVGYQWQNVAQLILLEHFPDHTLLQSGENPQSPHEHPTATPVRQSLRHRERHSPRVPLSHDTENMGEQIRNRPLEEIRVADGVPNYRNNILSQQLERDREALQDSMTSNARLGKLLEDERRAFKCLETRFHKTRTVLIKWIEELKITIQETRESEKRKGLEISSLKAQVSVLSRRTSRILSLNGLNGIDLMVDDLNSPPPESPSDSDGSACLDLSPLEIGDDHVSSSTSEPGDLF